MFVCGGSALDILCVVSSLSSLASFTAFKAIEFATQLEYSLEFEVDYDVSKTVL